MVTELYTKLKTLRLLGSHIRSINSVILGVKLGATSFPNVNRRRQSSSERTGEAKRKDVQREKKTKTMNVFPPMQIVSRKLH
mmetsp:Transcript_34532/g.52059  ORF Transcript_34532/g.52059 Transcript_34532/m.52059 type:complete len:82 (+) Transcript_34532:32-277(+)